MIYYNKYYTWKSKVKQAVLGGTIVNYPHEQFWVDLTNYKIRNGPPEKWGHKLYYSVVIRAMPIIGGLYLEEELFYFSSLRRDHEDL